MTGKEWAGSCNYCNDGWIKLTYEEAVGPITRGCPQCGTGMTKMNDEQFVLPEQDPILT